MNKHINKNIYIWVAACSFILIPELAISQHVIGTQTQGADMSPYPFGSIKEFDIRNSEIKGSFYLFDDYRQTLVVSTAQDSIEFTSSNINLINNNIEFKSEDHFKFLSSKYIAYFLLSTDGCYCDKFYIGNFYTKEGDEIKGVYNEEYKNENFKLFKFHELKLLKSNYNTALDHGRKNDEYKQEKNYYLFDGKNIIPLDVSNRKFSKYFKQRNKVYKFLKESDLELDNIEDLTSIADFLSTLDLKQ